jgi:hypothetical protein
MSAALGDSCLEMDPSAPAIYDPGRGRLLDGWCVRAGAALLIACRACGAGGRSTGHWGFSRFRPCSVRPRGVSVPGRVQRAACAARLAFDASGRVPQGQGKPCASGRASVCLEPCAVLSLALLHGMVTLRRCGRGRRWHTAHEHNWFGDRTGYSSDQVYSVLVNPP